MGSIIANMGTLYENVTFLCTQRGITPGKLCSELGMPRSTLSDLKSGRKQHLTTKTACSIADYFGISVDSLLGRDQHAVTDADLKAALFGTSDVPDETYQEVRRYAQYLMTK